VVVDKRRRSPTYSLRFRAYGRREYVTLGTAEDGWTQAKAQTELENVLADVRRGLWRPPVAEPAPVPREVPTFHAFASEWFERQKIEGGRRGKGLALKGCEDLQWRLSNHLPPLPKLTPHSLRRTFCSVLYALGEDPGTVMDEMGHANPALALRVYRQAMRRGEDEKAQLGALVEGTRTGVETQKFALEPEPVACAADASTTATA
jgi:hypothetical protein